MRKLARKSTELRPRRSNVTNCAFGTTLDLSIKLPKLSQDIFSLQSNALPASIKHRVVPSLPFWHFLKINFYQNLLKFPEKMANLALLYFLKTQKLLFSEIFYLLFLSLEVDGDLDRDRFRFFSFFFATLSCYFDGAWTFFYAPFGVSFSSFWSGYSRWRPEDLSASVI